MNRALIAVLAASGVAHAQAEPPDGSEPPAPPLTPSPEPQAPPETTSLETSSPPAPPATSFVDPPSPPPDTLETTTAGLAPADMGEQGIGASLGVATGGRTTAGGARVTGHYLYQLSAQDWFDGTAAFTFGSGGAACFRDRMDTFLCDHALADGNAVEVHASVRRFLGGREHFWPYLRAGVGIGIVRFSDDDVTGVTVPLHAAAGLRVSVSPGVAIVGEAGLELGLGRFNQQLGFEPQLGALVTAGAEFRL